ncbi:unnamed protein product [Cyclocybe aegerita]|uniref:Uncharacterized protein n=1 Tax=Cyclocybe aegerita TaxID=1973307 RepID=A0A8S0WQL4_CYCAE|nr:unnamed protein product [Cyclocybe aegerita]
MSLPETHQELRNLAWILFGDHEKTKAKTVLMTSLIDPTGRRIWTVFDRSVYEHLVSTCSSDVLHVKVSFS